MVLQKWVNNSKQVNSILKVEIPKLFFDNILAPKFDTLYTRYYYPHVQLIFSIQQ